MARSNIPTPIELIVHGSSDNSSGSSLRRTQQNADILTRSPRTVGGGDATGEDSSVSDGAQSEGEVNRLTNLSKSAFTHEFRLAIKDQARLENLIAQADNYPADAWSKALLWAAASGQVEFITKFMQRRPIVLKSLLQAAQDSDGFTALHRAVVMGQKDVVTVLTRQGQDSRSEYFDILHARTPEGWTSLHLAVATGDEEMVEVLIDSYTYSATLPADSEWDFADNFWMTPLHYAVLGNLEAVMKQLLGWPAYDRHLNAHDYYMRTAAHMAACQADSSAIEILVNSRRVDINAVDCCSYTPLHWAVYVGATEAVRCLVSRSGERTIRTTEEDIEGRPVFQIAVENTMLDEKVCKDIEKILLNCTEVKDEVERLYRDRQVYVDASNAILVGATLIASVTFGGWLQPPGGNVSGTADRQLQVFWTFNSLSFFFSIATVMAGAGAVLPMEDVYIGSAVRTIRGALALTSFLLITSVVLVLGAFAASGFTSLASSPNLIMNMMVTTSVGSSVCVIILLWFLQRLYKIRPDWKRVIVPAVKKCYQRMTMSRRNLDLVDIEKELEAAEVIAREDMRKKYGRSVVDRYYHRVDLTDLVFGLKKASDRASQLRRVAHDTVLLFGIADEKGGGPMSVRHLKERVLEQRILAFEEAYERARMLRAESGRLQDPNSNTLILSHVGTRGLHHWIDEFPVYYCRAHMLKKDVTRWTRIHNQVMLVKIPKLEEEDTKFEYGMLAFED